MHVITEKAKIKKLNLLCFVCIFLSIDLRLSPFLHVNKSLFFIYSLVIYAASPWIIAAFLYAYSLAIRQPMLLVSEIIIMSNICKCKQKLMFNFQIILYILADINKGDLKMKTGQYTYTKQVSIDKIKKILEVLQSPMTRQTLQKKLFISETQAKDYLRHLRKTKQVYISDWCREAENQKTHIRPIYLAGNKKDKEKIKPMTYSQIYQAIKKDPEKIIARETKNEHRRKMKKFVPAPDFASFWIPRK